MGTISRSFFDKAVSNYRANAGDRAGIGVPRLTGPRLAMADGPSIPAFDRYRTQ
jgi:hypothetical protein